MTGYDSDQVAALELYKKATEALLARGYTRGVIELLKQAKRGHEPSMQEIFRRARRRSRPYVDRQEMRGTELNAGLYCMARDELEWLEVAGTQNAAAINISQDPCVKCRLDSAISDLEKINPNHELVELHKLYRYRDSWKWIPFEIARRFRDDSHSFYERPIVPTSMCFANMLIYVLWVTPRVQAGQESKA